MQVGACRLRSTTAAFATFEEAAGNIRLYPTASFDLRSDRKSCERTIRLGRTKLCARRRSPRVQLEEKGGRSTARQKTAAEFGPQAEKHCRSIFHAGCGVG